MSETDGLDLVWGIEGIAKLIGRSSQQTYYMLRTGQLPAKQVGERWVASRKQITAFFMGDAA